MSTTSHQDFPTLTEHEYDLIRDLWWERRENQSTLLQRHREISLAMLPAIAERLSCAVETIPALYHDQLAHAVVAAAIKDHFLSGSLTGELVMWTYFEGGGSVYLEAYGRLCFCSAFRVRHPHPEEGVHASGCEELWNAYANAVRGLLALPITPAPDAAANLCILDTTPGMEDQEREAHPDRSLQRLVARHLGLDEATTRRVWEMLTLPLHDEATAGRITTALQALQTHMCQFHSSLFTRTVVVVVDDAMPASALALFTVELRKWMGVPPLVVGVRWQAGTGWSAVTPALPLGPQRG